MRGRPRILTDGERSDKKRYAGRYKCAARDSRYKWIVRNPEKHKAQRELTRAISFGEIVRPGKCSACEKVGKIHGHHDDYAKPLEVRWLCARCHSWEHRPPKPPRKIKRAKPQGPKMSTTAAIALVLGRVQ